MSKTLTTFLFEAVNFLIVAGVLTWLLFRPVRAAIAKRQETLARERQEAADKLAEADRARQEIEQRLAQLDDELREKRVTAQQDAKQEAEQIVADARAAAERERAALKRQLTYLEHARIERISKIVATAAGQAVGRLLQDVSGTDLDAALLKEACRRLQAFEGNSMAPVVVESARELSFEERDDLKSAVGPAGDTAEFRTSDGLHVGLRISTNRGLIDLSDAGLAEFAERVLSSRLTTDVQSSENQAEHAESR